MQVEFNGEIYVECVERCPALIHLVRKKGTDNQEAVENPDARYAYGRSCVKKCPHGTMKYIDKCVSDCPCGYKQMLTVNIKANEDEFVCAKLGKDETSDNINCNACVFGNKGVITKEALDVFSDCVKKLHFPNELKIKGSLTFNTQSVGIVLADLKIFENVTLITGNFVVESLFVLDASHIGQVFPKLKSVSGGAGQLGDLLKTENTSNQKDGTASVKITPFCQRGLSIGLNMLKTVKSGNGGVHVRYLWTGTFTYAVY